MKHLLIDFENIQPKNLNNILEIEDACIWIFLGALHKNISIELCQSLLNFKGKVHFVKLKKSGKNALDFYLSFYLGRIIQQDPEAQIAILAKDCGYDILVEHINNHYPSVKIKRVGESIHFEQSLKISSPTPQTTAQPPSPPPSTLKNLELARPQDLYQSLRRHFSNAENFRPTLYHNLKNHIDQHLLSQNFSAWEKDSLEQALTRLIKNGYLSLDGATVHYHFGKDELETLIKNRLKHNSKQNPHTIIEQELKTQHIELSAEETLQLQQKFPQNQPIKKTTPQQIIARLFELNRPPANKNSLKNWLQNHLKNTKETEINTIIHRLHQEGKIEFIGKKIHYHKEPITNNKQKTHLKKLLNSPNRPNRQQTLINSLKHLLKITDQDAEQIIQELINNKTIQIINNTITYLKPYE